MFVTNPTPLTLIIHCPKSLFLIYYDCLACLTLYREIEALIDQSCSIPGGDACFSHQ